MNRLLSLSVLLIFVFLSGCSATYKSYVVKIENYTSPTELIRADQELRFLDITLAEKNTLKKGLAKKGLPIMVQYTKAMLNGDIILEEDLIREMRTFIDKYIGYTNSKGKDIYLEVLISLEDLLKVVKIYKAKQEDDNKNN